MMIEMSRRLVIMNSYNIYKISINRSLHYFHIRLLFCKPYLFENNLKILYLMENLTRFRMKLCRIKSGSIQLQHMKCEFFTKVSFITCVY